MSSSVFAALITLAGSIIVAAIGYWTSKWRDREAEWRKEKLGYYKAFIESLSGIVEGDATTEGRRLYARATNNLLLLAPQTVVEALNTFRQENRLSNPQRSIEQHDRLLAALLLAIRRDIGIVPADREATFKPMLWASGVDKRAD